MGVCVVVEVVRGVYRYGGAGRVWGRGGWAVVGRVARASMTIQASRARGLAARQHAALEHPAHPRVAAWRLPAPRAAAAADAA